MAYCDLICLFCLFLLKIHAVFSRCCLDYKRRYLFTLKPHCLAPVRVIFVPCYVEVFAFKAVYRILFHLRTHFSLIQGTPYLIPVTQVFCFIFVCYAFSSIHRTGQGAFFVTSSITLPINIFVTVE